MRRTQRVATDLPENEWNFESCSKDEIYDCWLYEFAREIGWLKNIVERRRGLITTKYGHQTHVDTLSGFARQTWYSFLLRPDWPAQPYLSASSEERQKWIAWTRLKTEQEIMAEFLIPDQVPKGIDEKLAGSLRDLGRARIRSENNRLELVLLRIDWAMPDSLLIQALGAYLKEFRPIGCQILGAHRGKTAPDSTRLRQLEKLGRFRLLRANDQKVELARATGRLKTSNSNPWYLARTAVKELLEHAETRIIPRLSRVEIENFTSLSTPSKG